MIYYDGKIYRNLEEQVLKNQKDIEIYSAGGNFAIKGIVDGFDDLPESPTEGDYYLVGTGVPYELYLYYYNSWINLGEYPKEGPQGPQGIAGQNGATGPQGPQGPKGDSLVYEILDIVPTTDDLPDPDSVDYWDAYLVGSGIPYMAYFVINGEWTPVGYITPQEAQNVVTADSANASSYKLMMSAQSGTRKITESAWGITSTVVDAPNLIPSSQAVTSYVQSQVSAAVRFKGTITFAQLSALASAEVGDLYNISDSFTLSGVSYNAGTNLVCVTAFSSVITPSNTYWDAYGEAAVDLSPYMKSYTGDPTQWDTTPTAGSTKPVTSGGIKSELSDYAEIGTDPGFRYIHLYEQTESHQEQGEDAVIENVNGNLYFNGDPVGGGGGGIQNTATGTNSIGITPDNSSVRTATNTIALGSSVNAWTNYSVSVGNNSYGGNWSVNVGEESQARGNNSVAIGYKSQANKTNSYNEYYNIAIGSNSNSGVDGQSYSIALGSYAYAPKSNCIAIGSSSASSSAPRATGGAAISIGYASEASGINSIALGNGSGQNSRNSASSSNSIVIGFNSSAGEGAITIGNSISNNSSSYKNNVAIGDKVTITSNYGVSIGKGLAKTLDHDYSVVFNRCKFIPMTKSDSYTLGATMHGMTLTSTGVTYYAPSSTVTTGSSESALLICWYTD